MTRNGLSVQRSSGRALVVLGDRKLLGLSGLDHVPVLGRAAAAVLATTALFMVSPVLARLYPLGARWLRRRLGAVLDGGASCVALLCGHRLGGLVILTPKRARSVKLSTIWIAPRFRHAGLGTHLLHSTVTALHHSGVNSCYYTVSSEYLVPLLRLTQPMGFRTVCVEHNRYGRRRSEYVVSMPLRAGLSAQHHMPLAVTRPINRLKTTYSSDLPGYSIPQPSLYLAHQPRETVDV